MKFLDIFVKTPHGIHLRVASEVVRRIKDFNARVTISKNGGPPVRADLILELLLLAVTENTEIRVLAEGEDEHKAIQAVEEYFSDGGGI